MIITWETKAMLLSEIKALQEEKAALICDIDIIKNQISDQRRGKNEVYQETEQIKWSIYQLTSSLSTTKEQETEALQRFHKIVESQQRTIDSLSKSIKEYQDELDNMRQTKIIDVNKINQSHKKSIDASLIQLSELQTKIQQLEQLSKLIEKDNEINQNKLNSERSSIETQRTQLNIKSKNLEARELKRARLKEMVLKQNKNLSDKQRNG